MSAQNLNKLTTALRDICGRYVLEEKWLIAPSNRIGYQWLEIVTRSGQPVLNMRIQGIQHMALEIASTVMEEKGLTFITGLSQDMLVSRVFDHLKASGGGYLAGLPPGPGLINTLVRVIRDLRLAGITAGRLQDERFEAAEKGREIRDLLSRYENLLEKENRADYTGVLRIAAARLEKNPSTLPDPLILLMPQSMAGDLTRIERMFLDAMPRTMDMLGEDALSDARAEGETDASHLRWMPGPVDAPAPRRDGTAGVFHAVGEVNEVREVLRRCMEEKIPFDDVEIIQTDSETYVPLIYELTASLQEDESPEAPVTFYDGIPTRYARPARALMGWLAWLREGYPAAVLARMIQDGLLSIDGAEEKNFSFERLSGLLRNARPLRGLEGHMEKIDRAVSALARRMGSRFQREDEELAPPNRDAIAQEIDGLKIIRSLIAGLQSIAPRPDAGQTGLLQSAESLLENHARGVNQFDAYSRERLLKEIRELSRCLQDGDAAGLDVRAWLEELPHGLKVAGRGPRAGCLYVSPLQSGGHSGRRHTFILGLDDSRFPGAGLQDPVLLDSERHRISGDLPTAAARLARRVEEMAQLMARLRGSVTLSYCGRDLIEDRDMFPGPAVLSAYRILTGHKEGTQNDLIHWLGPPVSFAPGAPDRCVDMNEWWLSRLCGDRTVENAVAVTAKAFPHLGRGFQAVSARESGRFTEYDGYVPEAGADFNPGEPLSASRLQRLGACPMAYFFKYLLQIESPEDRRIDSALWIDAAQKGGLLHGVFRAFMEELRGKDRAPAFDRDKIRLEDLLEEGIAALQAECPPPNREIFERERRDMHRTALIFLQEEESFCRDSLPLFFEAAIGVSPEGAGTPLDTLEPVAVALPGGATIMARGRIDRVDEVRDSGGKRFTVWDYKTGSARRFMDKQGNRLEDPFDQGRLVQGIFYLELAKARLRKVVSTEAEVLRFGYFFPNIQAHGERIQWEAGELSPGKSVMAQLLKILRAGCFACSDDEKDIRYSEYLHAIGDPKKAAQKIKEKFENMENESLEPFAKLRGYKEGDGGET